MVRALCVIHPDCDIQLEASQTYNVLVRIVAADGTNLFRLGLLTAKVPLALSAKKANTFIREWAAETILTETALTIDPDDIYFPNP